MFNYFDYIISINTRNAVLLYTAILVVSFIFASLSQGKNVVVSHKNGEITTERKFNYFWFLVTFLFLWFFYALNNTGKDYLNYIAIFNNASLANLFDSQIEKGYLLLNIFLKAIIPNATAGIAIIKSISLIFVFWGIYNYRCKININIAILAYVGIFYFWSFNVIRICLAGAIAFSASKFLLNKKYLKYLIIIMLSGSIHFSAFSLLLPFFVSLFMQGNKKLSLGIKSTIVAIVFMAILIGSPYILKALSKIIPFFVRYQNYIESIESFSVGLGIIIYQGFPLITWLFVCRLCKNQKSLNETSYAFLSSGILISILGYMSLIITRMSIFFNFTLIVTMPNLIYNLRTNNKDCTGVNITLGYDIIFALSVIYFILRFIFYINATFISDGIDIFTFIWH